MSRNKNKKIRRRIYEPERMQTSKEFIFCCFDFFTIPFSGLKNRIVSDNLTDNYKKTNEYFNKLISEYKYLGKYEFPNVLHYLAISASTSVARTGLYFRKLTDEYLNDVIFFVFDSLKITDTMIGDIEEQLGMSIPIYNSFFVNNNIVESTPYVDTLSYYTLMFTLQKKGYIGILNYVFTFCVIDESLKKLYKRKEKAIKENDIYEIQLITTEILYAETSCSILNDLMNYILKNAVVDLAENSSSCCESIDLIERIKSMFNESQETQRDNDEATIEEFFKEYIYSLNGFIENHNNHNFSIADIPLNVKIKRIDPSDHVIKLLNESTAKDIIVFPNEGECENNPGEYTHSNETLNEMLTGVIDTQNCRILTNIYSNQLRSFELMRGLYSQREKEKADILRKISCIEKNLKHEKTKTQNYKAHSRELRNQIKTYEDKIKTLDPQKISNLENTVNDQKIYIAGLQKDLSDAQNKLNNKKHKNTKKDEKINSLEQENEKLKEQLEILMKEKDELQDIVDYISEHNDDTDVQEDDFSDESLQIAAICKLTFFVPVWVNSKPLEKLFPNSKFIKLQEDSNFDIGPSSQGVILCTKGAAHATYYMITNQCEKYGIKLTPVPSYGVKTMFNAAINAL